MRHAFYFFTLLVLFSACKNNTKPGHDFVVEGAVTNIPDGKVYLEEIFFDRKPPVLLDSSDVKEGKFTIGSKAAEEGFYRLTFADMPSGYVFTNDQKIITFKADGNDFSLNGPNFESPGNKDLKNFLLKLDADKLAYAKAQAALDSVSMLKNSDSLVSVYHADLNRIEQNFSDDLFNSALATKSPVVAMMILGYATVNDTARMVKLLPELLKKFPDNSGIKAMDDQFRQTFYPESVAPATGGIPTVGSMAPDFTLNDDEGKPFALSSLKGKYVLVDFWASWCRPCRAENPNVVDAFNKFKNKNFTVFGVSLDTDRGAWKQAIKKDNLTWKHVSDLKQWESIVVPMYGIEGIPYNILLDPTGKIIATDLRGAELHAKLLDVLK